VILRCWRAGNLTVPLGPDPRRDLWEARVNLFAMRDTAIAFGIADAEGQNVRIRLDSATQQC
jgi:hypothetical protein